MKIVKFVVSAVLFVTCCELGIAQSLLYPQNVYPQNDFHAGIHSGSQTLKRTQLLEDESKDLYRSCPDPYCARCAKHLADYGHEYQYLTGQSQRQLWYGGTIGTVAIVTQRGYDPHGYPYQLRGKPASAIIPWEYLRTLNHAIREQVNARNAVATEETAQDRIILLSQLLADAKEQLRLTTEVWKEIEPQGKSCNKVNASGNVVGFRCTKTYKQFCADMKACRYETARQGFCGYCLAHAQYQFDQAYVADVENELASAQRYLEQKSAVATEAVRIALLSKEDADKATRFKRIQFKPPKYQEVLAAMGVTESLPENGEQPEEVSP